MTAYLPALIWLFSAIVCHVITRQRRLKNSGFRQILVAVLGPLAIPFFLAMKPGRLPA